MFKVWLVLLLLVGFLGYWSFHRTVGEIAVKEPANLALGDTTTLEEVVDEPGVVAGVEQADQVEDLFLVVRVIDGDTIELASGDRVRYIGVNTPETVHPNKAVECFGQEASSYNKQLIEGKWVRLEKDISDQDKYGRSLRYVYLNDQLVNLALVENGYAEVVTYPPDVKFADDFLAAQTEARNEGRGLWSACGPQVLTVPDNDLCIIKGNISLSGEKIFHVPSCDYYNQTVISIDKGERWFCSEAEALSAGWRKAQNCPTL